MNRFRRTLSDIWFVFRTRGRTPEQWAELKRRARMQQRLDLDMALYGNIFLRRTEDGLMERVDPTTVVLHVAEGYRGGGWALTGEDC